MASIQGVKTFCCMVYLHQFRVPNRIHSKLRFFSNLLQHILELHNLVCP